MTTQTYDNPSIGCYVDASAQSADDCNQRTIEFAEQYGFKHEEIKCDTDDEIENYSELVSEIADEAVEYLNGLETRSFLYWGFEDNSLFLMPSVGSAKDDCEFVSSKAEEYPSDDYEGEWLHVSDHGNCTLYMRQNGQDKEIWSCV